MSDGMPGVSPSWALSAFLCNKIRPGLRKSDLKVAGGHLRTKPNPSPAVGPAGLEKSIFWPLPCSFRPLGLLYYFTAKGGSTRVAIRRNYAPCQVRPVNSRELHCSYSTSMIWLGWAHLAKKMQSPQPRPSQPPLNSVLDTEKVGS
jgi:hypothetical protein